MFEANFQEEMDKRCEADDLDFVSAQVIGDRADDVDMEGVAKEDDFEFLDFELSEMAH